MGERHAEHEDTYKLPKGLCSSMWRKSAVRKVCWSLLYHFQSLCCALSIYLPPPAPTSQLASHMCHHCAVLVLDRPLSFLRFHQIRYLLLLGVFVTLSHPLIPSMLPTMKLYIGGQISSKFLLAKQESHLFVNSQECTCTKPLLQALPWNPLL